MIATHLARLQRYYHTLRTHQFTAAEIQSYLLGFKGEAEVAVEKAAEWVKETMRVELCSRKFERAAVGHRFVRTGGVMP